MSRSESAQFARIVDWLEGNLPEEESRALADQLGTSDKATGADVAWLRSFYLASRQVNLAAPPPGLRAELKRRFIAYYESHRQAGFFQRLKGSLSFDSRQELAVAGMRSAATEGSEGQLIYSTNLAEIALNIRPRAHDQRLNLTGQVFPSTEMALDNFSIQLLQNTLEAGLTVTDDLGEFTLEAVEPGEYDIILSADSFEVTLPAVPLLP